MNLFVAFSALLAVAAAAPKADPYYLLHPYLLSPHAKTADLVTHANGAVVPSDTVSVQAARAGHLAYKALGWPYHYLGKREAEAEPEADADPYYLYGGYGYHPAITSIGAFTTYTNGAVVPTNTPAVAAATASHLATKAAILHARGYGYGLLYGRKKREADPYFYGLYGYYPYGLYPAVTSSVADGLTTYSNGAVVPTDAANQAATAEHLAGKGYGLLYGRKKREAESNAEADPYYFYGLYGHHPWVTSVGALTTYSNGAVVPTDPANQAATAAHLASKGLVHVLGKREAEAEADPYYYYGLYGHYGHYPYRTSIGGFTTYSNGAVVPTDPANQAATAAHLAHKGAFYGYPYGGYGYWG